MFILGLVGGVMAVFAPGSIGAEGRDPLFAVEGEGELLAGEEEGEGGRGFCWWVVVVVGVAGGLS